MSSNIQPTFLWREGRHFDGRSQHVVVPHRPEWLLEQGVVVLDFTADRLEGTQGLLSKDAKGNLDGGHLTIWLNEGKVVVRLQDQKSQYVVQSPASTVKKGVPTRLALAFGPGGMRLYVDGNVVGSHAYQGGLQGNQEPLVIGARDSRSSPGAADNLEAFFAGTIGALAIYDRAPDAPAIAALGPAGTALAQVAGPDTGVQLPASVDFGVQQPVQFVVTSETTITIAPEELEKNLSISPTLGGTPIPGAPVTVASAPKIFNPTVMGIEQSIRQQTSSTDENQLKAAIYARLMEIVRTPSPSRDKQAVSDWLVLQVKQTRIEAARLALAEYDRWNRDPWSYQPPTGYDFPAYLIPHPRSPIWLTTTPNPPVLANKSWQSWFTDIVSNNGWSPLNNPMLNKGQKNTSIENVVGFPTFGTVLAYQKLYGTEDGVRKFTETTAHLSGESIDLPPIGGVVASPANLNVVRVWKLGQIAPHSKQNLEFMMELLVKRIEGAPTIPTGKNPNQIDIAKSYTSTQLRSAISRIMSGEILGSFVASFVLSSALQEIISESFMLDTKNKLRGELVAHHEKQQSAQLPDLSNLLYYDIRGEVAVAGADYQPTDLAELERLMGSQEVYRAFLLSTFE